MSRALTLTLPCLAALAVAACDGEHPERRSFGYLDHPTTATLSSPVVRLEGWALDPDGVDRVEVVLNGRDRFTADYGLKRTDVAAAYPDFQDGEHSGFSFLGDLTGQATGHDKLEVIVVDRNGHATTIAGRELVSAAGRDIWRALFSRHQHWADDPFFVLPATSGIGNGGARGLAESYAPYNSATIRAGVRVPILYMRTTGGADNDWVFDPDFDVTREQDGKTVTEDSLNSVLAFSLQQGLPVLFTLNGGVWADSRITAPRWDLTDHLEEDPANCQWNQDDEVFADDYLKHLPGSEESPELARALTLNFHAATVRDYKKRNLQAAGARVAAFARENPGLFAGINLDPDVYLNPFFDGKWHDFNPGTLRQFREWLGGFGPYAEAGPLAEYRKPAPYTLAQVSELSGEDHAAWQSVDPPRSAPKRMTRLAEDPWLREWELFRRHLVDLHYDELSAWLTETGIDSSDIYSSQGFIAPRHVFWPFAVYLDSPVKNYDSGGMSVEGSIPRYGHLGAILYGESSANNIGMETDESLFGTFARLDPDWGVVEYNTADFREPDVLPGYAMAYRSLRDIFNYHARLISPMAWNGSSGEHEGKPGFVSHTAYRKTPMELAIKDFMVSHANLPRRALLWTFGNSRHRDFDRWTSPEAEGLRGAYGHLTVPRRNGAATLLSPTRLQLDPLRHNLLVVGVDDPARIAQVRVLARSREDSQWKPAGEAQAPVAATAAGLEVPLHWPDGMTPDQVRIELTFAPGTRTVDVHHIAILPNAGLTGGVD